MTLPTDDRRSLERFTAYAAAFETAYATDDWTVLAPHFTESAVTELNGARVEGRPAVLASFRDGVAMFDRRFDSRAMRIVEGPDIQDGVLHIKTVNTYCRDGLAPLELVGEEWFHFDGDRIARHVDQVVNLAEVMSFLGQHAGALRPMPNGATP